MRKILLFGSIALLPFFCSNYSNKQLDNNFSNKNVILPVKITINGIAMKINYDNNKIISIININNPKQRIEFSYTDDYVTSIKNYDNNILERAIEYKYNGDHMSSALTKKYSSRGSIESTVAFTYTYINATKIDVKKQTHLGATNTSTINSVYTYNNGNMVNNIGSGTGMINGKTIEYRESEIYSYTNKNYAFKNVKGFDKIIFNGNQSSNSAIILFSNIKNSLSSYKGLFINNLPDGEGGESTTHQYTTTFNNAGFPLIENRQIFDTNGNPATTVPDKFIYEYNFQ